MSESNNPKLPKEFKFKAADDVNKTIKFILLLISKGFETACDKEEFITKHVLSKEFDAFAVEDNKVVLHGTGKDYDNDPSQEVLISDFNLVIELSSAESNAINNNDMINEVIKDLSKIDPSKLSCNEVDNIDIFRMQLKNMASY
jgi:hypothetical protein